VVEIFVNGLPRQVPAPLTLADLLASAELPSRGVAVAVDGSVVPRAEHATTTLGEGARIEIVTAVQGG
jgi:sulfur carrier protein